MNQAPYTLFIADLHLSAATPKLNQGFVALLQSALLRGAEKLYILGDFVEFWVGDDMPLVGMENVFSALGELADSNIHVYFQHGNRDFMVGADFAQKYNITLLGDHEIIDLYNRPTLLCHGDTLCTDDVQYQHFRTMVRNPAWQAQMLALPISARIKMAEDIRSQTTNDMQHKSMEIMDVNEQTVAEYFVKYHVNHIIHGHTHRPAIHEYANDLKRIVLSDWNHQQNQQGNYLIASDKALKLENFAL